MEYIREGTLYDILHRRKIELNDKQKGKIARQTISAIHYLHSHGIVHKDIKSHNVLIDGGYDIKICDFGLSRHKVLLHI